MQEARLQDARALGSRRQGQVQDGGQNPRVPDALPRQCPSVPPSFRESQLRGSPAQLHQVRRVQAKDYLVHSVNGISSMCLKPTEFFSPRTIYVIIGEIFLHSRCVCFTKEWGNWFSFLAILPVLAKLYFLFIDIRNAALPTVLFFP